MIIAVARAPILNELLQYLLSTYPFSWEVSLFASFLAFTNTASTNTFRIYTLNFLPDQSMEHFVLNSLTKRLFSCFSSIFENTAQFFFVPLVSCIRHSASTKHQKTLVAIDHNTVILATDAATNITITLNTTSRTIIKKCWSQQIKTETNVSFNWNSSVLNESCEICNISPL